MNPDLPVRTVRLPVVFENGAFTLPSGKAIPALREGTLGDLVVDASDLVNDQEREAWTKERTVPFLPRGTSLWARIKPEVVSIEIQKHITMKREWPGSPLDVVAFKLTADLQIILRAGKKAALERCPCHIAALDVCADSVNEAYAKISVAFEPGRRSHTGNVFLCVFYEGGGLLHPLDSLRKRVELTTDLDAPR